MSAVAVAVGFFGKIPSRGDFVRAGLSRQFIAAWDGRLQDVLPACGRLLGSRWEEAWRTAPAWRFALPGGRFVRHPVLGLFLPSVDRAGRRFPLTIAAEGADDGRAFLDEAEQVGRDAIDAGLDPEMLLARLRRIAPPPPARQPILPEAVGRWWSGPESLAAAEALAPDGFPAAPALAGMLDR